MVKTTKPFVLLIHWRNPFITSAGTEKFIQLQVETFKKADIDSIIVFPVRKKVGITIFGWGMIVNKQFLGVYDESKVIRNLQETLNQQTCKGVFVHHLMWSNLDTLQRILSFTPEIIFYVHDYYSCCEQQNLLKNDEYYCGDGELRGEKCKDCMYYNIATEKKQKTKTFFESFNKITVVAPSEVAAAIWKQSYPEYASCVKIIEHLKVEMRKYETKEPRKQKDKLNIAFVGTGTQSKGWHIWIDALMELPEEIRDRYNFYHLGYAPKEYPFIKHIPVSIAEDGPDAMIRALGKYDIDVAMLLSIWPETYCYTFFEALQSGCYTVTTNLSGNIEKQVQSYGNGHVIDVDKNALKSLLENESELQKAVHEYRELKLRSYNMEYSKDFMDLLKDTVACDYNTNIRVSRINTARLADILYRIRYRKNI